MAGEEQLIDALDVRCVKRLESLLKNDIVVAVRCTVVTMMPCLACSHAQRGFLFSPLAFPGRGGFRLRPTRVEFWEGQPSRLHDRIVYTLDSDGTGGGGEGNAETWSIKRLQP